ncbi:MAG: DUF2238 domain-containing protein [Verrucomicrobia subdivision 3 bacterium]|nr:DUF2238 domain-containing protein [Limisphaerales bacterium]
MVALSLLVAPAGSTYQWSFAILAPLLWAAYFLRERLALYPPHYAMFAAALLLHNLGAFGFYRRRFVGFEFDLFVHFYFGVVAGCVFYRAFERFYDLNGAKLWLAVALFTLGVGALHEVIEWSTTLIMGPQRGMLKLDADDPFDTQKDLFNNLAGALLACAAYFASRLALRRTRLGKSVLVQT